MSRIILLLALLCCTMCKRTQQYENTIYADIDNPQKASLFDYFRSVELIPLETSSNVLMKSISRLVYHQNRYYALDKPQAIIFVFDRDGNSLFKIDKKGNGPGEYSSIEDVLINPFTGRLEILTAYGFVHEYDLSGDFIETKRISYPDFRAVHQFAAVDSNIHVFYSMFQPREIIYFTLDDKKLLHEEFEESQQIGSFGYDNLYSYNDEWYFFRPFHPCVYKVGKEQLEEVFRFDFGKYTREGTKAVFSEETRHGPSWFEKTGRRGICPVSLLDQKVRA